MGCCASKGVDRPCSTTTEPQLASPINDAIAAHAADVLGDFVQTAPVSGPANLQESMSSQAVQDANGGLGPEAAHPHATSPSSLAKSLFKPTSNQWLILAEPGLSCYAAQKPTVHEICL